MTDQSKIKANLEGKEPYVLNLSDDMGAEIVKNSREKIAQLEARKEAYIPTYEKEKAFFMEAKKNFEAVEKQMASIESDIAKQKNIVDVMTNFRRNKAGTKELRVNAPAETRQGTKAPKRTNWLKEAVDVLAAEQRFMSADEIFNKIIEKEHVKENLKKMASGTNGVRNSTISGFLDHALKVVKGQHSAALKPTLFVYKELVGLVDWAGTNWVPKPEYIRQFMYAAQ